MATQSELQSIRSYAESLQGDERKVFIDKTSKLDESKLSILANRLPKQPIAMQGQEVSSNPTKISTPSMERQNVIGSTFNVPAAAIRSKLQGTGYVEGALNPSKVPSFKEVAASKVMGIKNPVLRTIAGMGAVSIGNAADVVTNPAELLTGVVAKPLAQLGSLASKTKPAQEFGKFLSKMKPQMHTPEWLQQQAKTVGDAADNAVKTVQGKYEQFFAPVNDRKVDVNKLQEVVDTLYGRTKSAASKNITQGTTYEPKLLLNPEEHKALVDMFSTDASATVKNAKEIQNIIQNKIPEVAWMKPSKLEKLSPENKELINAWHQTKKIINSTLSEDELSKLSKLNANATEAYRVARATKKMVLDPTGKPVDPDKLISIFKGGADKTGKKQLLDRLSKLDSSVKNVERNMESFVRRQKIKQAAIGTLGAGTALGITAKVLGGK